ncbi:uncharacterized protein N7458_001627 [Penicillium daleae]|uniref:NmrA-like domain-containing protein n=1 Tax=Penicillium daleae TaxID=63821 RepID=A0AAD6G5Z2_9EURO|nr:uncharacterized protein N7458_001627 [Penicillium daleae]KAJ5460075.1 hypothetical protein N7458_001627 [Penicillium daleae]
MSQSVLVIGGSGAQGMPVVKELSRQSQYSEIRVLTRDSTSENSQNLATLPKVSLYIGQPDNEDDLKRAFTGIDLVHVNLNSFALGIKNELYWGIRIYEIAVQSGVKHLIWSSLDRYMVDTNFNDELRAGHYYGKAYVEQWLSAIPQRKESTRWSIMTTGPYIQMLSELLRPRISDDGTYIFEAPLGNGLVPFVHLDDLGHYVHWIFSNPDESAGMNVKVAIEHVSYEYLAATFTKVTGNAAVYRDVTIDEWFTAGPLSDVADVKLGADKGQGDPTLLSYRQNFTAWWKLYQRAGEDRNILKRDYDFLDRIFPGRVRTVEEWMRKVGYTGAASSVLKTR